MSETDDADVRALVERYKGRIDPSQPVGDDVQGLRPRQQPWDEARWNALRVTDPEAAQAMIDEWAANESRQGKTEAPGRVGD